jgi:hypothetical protein
MPFETFGFATNYTVELNPEQPGGGWADRPRVMVRPGTNEAVLAEVTPSEGAAWLAVDGAFTGTPPWLCATPNPNVVCFGAGWSEVGGRLVDVSTRETLLELDSYMPNAYGVVDLDLLLLVSYTDMVAIGADGISWESGQLAWDDLTVLGVGAEGILCEGFFGGQQPVRFTVDPATGRGLSGPFAWRPNRGVISRFFRSKAR